MALDPHAAKQVLAAINRDELAQLDCALTDIPSPTGQEKAIADHILAWFRANGLKAIAQEVEIGRPNAVGVLKGTGGGLSLGFNGHTDTSYTGTVEDLRMIAEVEPESELRGVIVGDKVRGLGISNMKGGLAAFMMAGVEPIDPASPAPLIPSGLVVEGTFLVSNRKLGRLSARGSV